MSLYKKYAFRGLIAGAFIALVGIVGGFVTNNKPISASGTRDCDSNAVLYCGAMTVDELLQKYNSTSDVPALYNYFGITPDKVNGLKTTVALGEVHKDGTVWLKNGTLLGSNAMTAARKNFAGSTPVPGTNFYMRPPSVSFAASSIDAFIGFENGKPAWAILSACGNPVKFNHPHITMTKQVADPKTGAWVKDAVYPNNSNVQYLLTVKNDGTATDTHIGVIDKLPAYQTFTAGSVKINNVAVAGDITSTGIFLDKLAPGQIAYITFSATVTVPPTKCGVTDMTNIAREDSNGSGTTQDSANTHVNVTCLSVKCDSLSGPDTMKIGDTAVFTANVSDASLVAAYNFTVNSNPVPSNGNKLTLKLTGAGTYRVAVKITPKANVIDGGSAACVKSVVVSQNPVVKTVKCDSLSGPDTMKIGETANFTANVSDASLVQSYVFTVNGNVVPSNGNTLTLKLTSAGTYTVAAKITPIAGVIDGGSAACVKTVTVKEVPKPIYSCDSLTVSPTTVKTNEQVTAHLTYTAQNGATFKSASFNFGDNTSNPISTDANNVSAVHSYASAGTYAVTIPSLIFTVNGKDVVVNNPSNCVARVTVTEMPEIVTSCDALDASKLSINLGETTTLTAHATAVNTTVTGYEFTVNGQTVQNTSTSTYDFKPTAAGNYAVAVKVHFANGDVKGGTGTCAKTICVTEVVTPIYSCDLLTLSTATIKDGDKVTATVKYTANNGATFKSAVVNFGEASVNVATASNGSFTADYTYKTAKDYTVTATITFTVNGKDFDVTSSNCAAKISTTPPQVKGVTTLPNTGAGNVIGLFAAVTAAGAVLHNVWMRKFNR